MHNKYVFACNVSIGADVLWIYKLINNLKYKYYENFKINGVRFSTFSSQHNC